MIFLTDSIMEKDLAYICALEDSNTLRLLRDAGYGELVHDLNSKSIQVNLIDTQFASMY
jgi:hypothetical protein